MGIFDAFKKQPETDAALIERAAETLVKNPKQNIPQLFKAISSKWNGADRSRLSMGGRTVTTDDADSSISWDRQELVNRSRDAERNYPIATAILDKLSINVVGSGFTLLSRVDADELGITTEEAKKISDYIEKEWELFANSVECDATRTQVLGSMAKLWYTQKLRNGDAFINLIRIDQKKRPGNPYTLALQGVEADRISNKNFAPNTDTLFDGVEKDEYGAPIAYHVMRQHPGAYAKSMRKDIYVWDIINAFDQNGLRKFIHLYEKKRDGQSRGFPKLAPILEKLKQSSDFSEGHLNQALASQLLAVFIESENQIDLNDLIIAAAGGTTTKSANAEYRMGSGPQVINLQKGDKVNHTTPALPSPQYTPFFTAQLQEISMSMGISYEVLSGKFEASYSAARAALLEFWKLVVNERAEFARTFYDVVYENWFWEAVASGRIEAPGFFTDYRIRRAYLRCEWRGAPKGMINEAAEMKAARDRVDMGISNLDIEAANIGNDFDKIWPQRIYETEIMSKIAPAIPVADNAPIIDPTIQE